MRLLLTLGLAGLSLGGTISAQLTSSFFDDTKIVQINLEMDPADWASLQKNFLENTYYPATFNTGRTSLAVGIRSHGLGSRSPVKPNLDINFKKFTKKQTFLG